jgi:hypothetical protein
MSQHQKEIAFLKTLTLYGSSAEAQYWRERIHRAEHDERALCHAIGLVTWVLILSICALAYQSILQPELYDELARVVIKILYASSLASVVCLVVFAVGWLYLHQVSNWVYEQARHFVLSVLDRQYRPENQVDPEDWKASSVRLPDLY